MFLERFTFKDLFTVLKSTVSHLLRFSSCHKEINFRSFLLLINLQYYVVPLHPFFLETSFDMVS